MRARFGLLGGSFNPIHIGHLVIAERACEELKLGRIILVPTGDTPMKDPRSLAPARHRLAMARLAVRGSRLTVSPCEVSRRGMSYTIDTVEALEPDFLVIGADSLAALPRWHRIRDLAARVTFAIAARPGFKPGRVPGYIRHTFVRAPLLDISATDLRERLRTGRSIRWLVPDAVERYIRRHGIYQC